MEGMIWVVLMIIFLAISSSKNSKKKSASGGSKPKAQPANEKNSPENQAKVQAARERLAARKAQAAHAKA